MSVTYTPLSDDEMKLFTSWLNYCSLETRLYALLAVHTARIKRARSLCKKALSSLTTKKTVHSDKKYYKLQQRKADIQAWAAHQEATAYRVMGRIPAVMVFARYKIVQSSQQLRMEAM